MTFPHKIALTIYKNSAGLQHDTGAGHPESIERLKTVLSLLEDEPALNDIPVIESPEAETKWLRYGHERDYIMNLQDAVPDHGYSALDNDTIISPLSYEAAITAAGGACSAVQDIHDGNTARAFIAARPPGHHAEPDRAMGFCLFNTAFIAARYAQEQCGYTKVAIIDFDVHHGNGTQAMTERVDNILYISSHQARLFPGDTGYESSNIENKILNIEFPAGAASAAFRSAYENRVFPALNHFAPDFMIMSAGFDAHIDDPLGGLALTDDDFAWVTKNLCSLADKHCEGRIVSVLEGGYNLAALKSACRAHILALAGA